MTDQVQATGRAEVSADDIRAVKFNRVIGRGYEQHEVDAFVDKCAAWIDWFNQQLRGAQQELDRLQLQVADSGGEQVQQAIQVLTNAQQTADTTVRKADQYSLRVMSEAKQLYEEARLRTAAMEQEATVRAKGVSEDAAVRAEQLQRDSTAEAERVQRDSTEQAEALLHTAEQRASALERGARASAEKMLAEATERVAVLDEQARTRMAELGETATVRQAELDKQTAYLRTLRDSSRVSMQKFLEGMLDHLADEYGRADPAAASAASDGKPAAAGAAAARRLVGRPKRSTRRSYRSVPASHSVSGGPVPAQRTGADQRATDRA